MEDTSDGCRGCLPQQVLKKEVYIKQPQGFEVHGRDCHVCRLKKALNRLKQVPRAWYSRINGYMLAMGFIKSEADPNLYFTLVGDDPLILVLMLITCFLPSQRSSLRCAREIKLRSSR